MRTLTYTISEEDAGLRTEQYLSRRGYSRPLMTQLKKNPSLLLCNHIPCRLNRILSESDVLFVSLPEDVSSDTIIPVRLPLDICYEDEDILIVNKPPGMPIHPSRSHPSFSLANALAWHYNTLGIPFIFRCTNRLDRDTSGLTVIAKHALSASILSSMAVHHEICREYLAIVRGTVIPPSGTICAPLSRKPGPVIERIVDWEHGESAVTHYRSLCEKNSHSLISLTLETGRTHQIRIHMKYLGYPLIGDYLYNPDTEWISRQALHSWRLSFFHPITGKKMNFSAPLPQDMKNVLLSQKNCTTPPAVCYTES